MLIVNIPTRNLMYENLSAIVKDHIAAPGDYYLLHEEHILYTTLRWGLVMDDNERVEVMMEAFENMDGEPFGVPVTREAFVGEWTFKSDADAFVDLTVLVKVDYS